ncbi:MAG: DEAD/DEAH box helicase family protein [Rhodoferax sp.]|nr:DEAD/DEAH box helicase family protein [Rhodoferax sp.]MCF8210162.1 DEAD/DEAH box helicase family protein [Rhodoferax sp.]
MSNFAFLQSEWSTLYGAASKAEGMANTDARTFCFYARRTLELAVDWLYKHDKSLRLPYQDHLSALIHEPTFKTTAGDAVFTQAKLIKDLGNTAVHSTRLILRTDALTATRELFHFCYWLARTYGQRARPEPDLRFDAALIPLPPAPSAVAAAPAQSIAQLQKLEAELQARDEKLSTLLSAKAALADELQKLRLEVAAAKKANTAQPDTHDYSESETRDYFIDLLLKEAGWQLDAKNFEVQVSSMPNNQGVGFVDYVLWGDDGRPLVVLGLQAVGVQLGLLLPHGSVFAGALGLHQRQRPIIFYSNGYEHWMWDDASYPPRSVQGFFKKQELELLIQRRTSRKKLADAVINDDIINRYYQHRAVRRIGETFEVENQRKALLVMATGGGKTRVVVALADVLTRCNWAMRILFLADRVALVKQAVTAFKTHLPDSAPVNLVTEKHADGRVFVSTYPTMMGLIDDAATGQRRFGVGHFDLIIIDEAHRSVYQKYRAIFDYFEAMLVGLTATPKDEIDHNTYGLFDLESGVPTDVYGLDEAVAEGYLVPPKAVSVPLKFQREGIKYQDLSEEEKEQWDALEWDEDGNVPDAVDSAALNKWLFNTDTVDKVLENLMTHGEKVAGGDRLGKTIIFAKNNAHADFIAERFNVNYPHYKGAFARVVTYKTEYAQTLIDAFSIKDSLPHIAISVDMLDTGIDVPEVVNLLFFKAIRSKTKFWQMIGRGTRLCPDLYGPGQHKQFFNVFDYCQNLEYFNQELPPDEAQAPVPLSTRLFRARLAMVDTLDKLATTGSRAAEQRPPMGDPQDDAELRDALADLMHQQVAAMNLDNFVVRPRRKLVERFAKLASWNKLDAKAHTDLSQQVADLPTALLDNDEEAKRFDLLVLRTQLTILQALPDYVGLRERMQAIASALEEQEAIPAIKAQMVLIQAVAGDEWWEDVTVVMLEAARRRLRALVKLIEKGKRPIVYTDFEDEIGNGTAITLPGVSTGMNLAKFKDKARQFLREHESHLSLQRLRRNQPLTPSDLVELERMLVEAGGSTEVIEQAKAQSHGLGIFIRSLVGLDRETAKQAFSQFVVGTTATASQIEFIDLIVQYLTENGVMDAARLYESPFTDISQQGPEALFLPAKVTEMVRVLDEIWERAAA